MNGAAPAIAEAATDRPSSPAAGRVVVGYDGTAGALPALTWAADEALRTRAELVVVRAWNTDDELAEPGLTLTTGELGDLALDTLPDSVRATPSLRVETPAHGAGQAIVAAATPCTTIVVGRRRLGALQRAWLGSVSSYVVQHAACPVVVVPEVAHVVDLSSLPQERAGHASDAPAHG